MLVRHCRLLLAVAAIVRDGRGAARVDAQAGVLAEPGGRPDPGPEGRSDGPPLSPAGRTSSPSDGLDKEAPAYLAALLAALAPGAALPARGDQAEAIRRARASFSGLARASKPARRTRTVRPGMKRHLFRSPNITKMLAAEHPGLMSRELLAYFDDMEQQYDLYAIGDTHGDWVYFKRCMLSTGYFEVKYVYTAPPAGPAGGADPPFHLDLDGELATRLEDMAGPGVTVLARSASNSSEGSDIASAPPVEETLTWKHSELQHARRMLQAGFKQFHIYVLGDMIDRGSQSLRILRTLRDLQAQLRELELPELLTVLLGNHESMLLLGDIHEGYINQERDDFPYALRTAAFAFEAPAWSWSMGFRGVVQKMGFRGKEEQEVRDAAALMQWLSQLPIVARDDRAQVLLAHGGVGDGSEPATRRFGPPDTTLGVREAIAEANQKAKRVFATARTLGHKLSVEGGALMERLEQLDGYGLVAANVFDPNGFHGDTGPLWYRGYATSLTDQQVNSFGGFVNPVDGDDRPLVDLAGVEAFLEAAAAARGLPAEPTGRFQLPATERIGKFLAGAEAFAGGRQLLVHEDAKHCQDKEGKEGCVHLRKGTVCVFPARTAGVFGSKDLMFLDRVPARSGVGAGEETQYGDEDGLPWGQQNCRRAEAVGLALGAKRMVVAHTVVPHITEYCAHARVPIFLVDTHPDQECEVDTCSEEVTFEAGRPVTTHRPFSLRLKFRRDEADEDLACFASPARPLRPDDRVEVQAGFRAREHPTGAHQELAPAMAGTVLAFVAGSRQRVRMLVQFDGLPRPTRLKMKHLKLLDGPHVSDTHCKQEWVAQPAAHAPDGSITQPLIAPQRPRSRHVERDVLIERASDAVPWGLEVDSTGTVVKVAPGSIAARAEPGCGVGTQVLAVNGRFGATAAVAEHLGRAVGETTLTCAPAQPLGVERASQRHRSKRERRTYTRAFVDAALERYHSARLHSTLQEVLSF